jgi:hypothetical protein
MKDEHLGPRILLRDRFRSCERLFIRSVLNAEGIVIEVVAIAVDDAYD